MGIIIPKVPQEVPVEKAIKQPTKKIRNGKAEGFDFGEASWILEDNDMMNRGLETLSGEIYKRYAIYEKSI